MYRLIFVSQPRFMNDVRPYSEMDFCKKAEEEGLKLTKLK